MKHRARVWLSLFILLGLGASLTSLYVQYQILRDPTYTSFCDFSQAFNCETVYRSRFATFRGMPVALGEVIWFTLALLLILAARSSRPFFEKVALYLFSMSIVTLSVVLFQTYAWVFVVKTVSVWHMLSYLAVLGLFLMSGASASTPLSGLPRQLVQDGRTLATRPVALGVAIVFVAAALSAITFFSRTVANPSAALVAALAQQPTDFDLWLESQVRTPIELPADGAEVLILEFTDYQCATCAESHRRGATVLAKYQAEALSGTIRLVVKDYPQDPECNQKVAGEVHHAACEAAAAVLLARRHGREQAMEEWLYSHQAGLNPGTVAVAAKDIGEIKDFDSEYARALTLIKNDVDLAHSLGVKTVPTFFINGVRIEGDVKAEFLDQAVAHELRVAAGRQ